MFLIYFLIALTTLETGVAPPWTPSNSSTNRPIYEIFILQCSSGWGWSLQLFAIASVLRFRLQSWRRILYWSRIAFGQRFRICWVCVCVCGRDCVRACLRCECLCVNNRREKKANMRASKPCLTIKSVANPFRATIRRRYARTDGRQLYTNPWRYLCGLTTTDAHWHGSRKREKKVKEKKKRKKRRKQKDREREEAYVEPGQFDVYPHDGTARNRCPTYLTISSDDDDDDKQWRHSNDVVSAYVWPSVRHRRCSCWGSDTFELMRVVPVAIIANWGSSKNTSCALALSLVSVSHNV